MYIIIVGCCFVLNAGGACYLIARARFGRREKRLFALAAFASIALKLILASRWSDYDLDSYKAVASLVLHGRSVYANTDRYNYGPIWALFLAGLSLISALLPAVVAKAFHLSVAAFLAVVDLAIAALLAAKYRFGAGIFFLFCPVTIILTGSYSQFDNFALLTGLAAWLLVREGNAPYRRIFPSAGLLGLSLAIKHIFFLFPLWMLFWPKLGCIRKRLAYAAMTYGLFGISFLPWAVDPVGRAGIYRHVFRYRSTLYLSILHLLAASRQFWTVSAIETTVLTLIWMAVLLTAGVKVGSGNGEIFPMYLLAMIACSPALNDYYFALPMLACAILYPSWPIWALTSLAIVALFGSPGGIFDFPFSRIYYLAMLSSQVAAAALFIVQQRRSKQPGSDVPAPQKTAQWAVTLALGSVAVMFLILLIKGWVLGYPDSSWILPADNG